MAPKQPKRSAQTADLPAGNERVKKFMSSDIQLGDEIGSGGFGKVYKGKMRDGSKWTDVAVKVFHTDDPKKKELAKKELLKEFENLKSLEHENVLKVIGYKEDPFGLILEYMINGSLQDRLACKNNSQPLLSDERLRIAYGAALGLSYLHSKFSKGKTRLVHCDFKSSNLLLDENLCPKVADMATVRKGYGPSSEPIVTQPQNMVCTEIYTAPEAKYGRLTIKLDTYSFGVVLLELISGLSPWQVAWTYLVNPEMKRFNFLPRIIDRPKFSLTIDHLDPEAGWDFSVAQRLYEVAKRCLAMNEDERPTISDILQDLENLKNNTHKVVCKRPQLMAKPGNPPRRRGFDASDIILLSLLGVAAGVGLAAIVNHVSTTDGKKSQK